MPRTRNCRFAQPVAGRSVAAIQGTGKVRYRDIAERGGEDSQATCTLDLLARPGAIQGASPCAEPVLAFALTRHRHCYIRTSKDSLQDGPPFRFLCLLCLLPSIHFLPWDGTGDALTASSPLFRRGRPHEFFSFYSFFMSCVFPLGDPNTRDKSRRPLRGSVTILVLTAIVAVADLMICDRARKAQATPELLEVATSVDPPSTTEAAQPVQRCA